MALDDVDTKAHCWYYSAWDNGMSDYATYTSGDFGAGEQNTSKMITKWNGTDMEHKMEIVVIQMYGD